jgi:hypothetical protein
MLLAVVLLAGGCATERRYPPPDLPASARLVEVGITPAQEPAIRQASATEDSRPAGRPLREVLVLSGGGTFGT